MLKKINLFLYALFLVVVFGGMFILVNNWGFRIGVVIMLVIYLFLDFSKNIELKRNLLPWVSFCECCGAMKYRRSFLICNDDGCWRCMPNAAVQRRKGEIPFAAVYGIGLLLVASVAGYSYMHTQGIKSEGEVQEAILRQEFERLQPMPQAAQTRFSSSHKDWQALVAANYHSDQSYPEVRAYYLAEAIKHGWTFQKEEAILIWGQDYGGKKLIFYKGDYSMDVWDNRGENKEQNNKDFSVSVSWGLK